MEIVGVVVEFLVCALALWYMNSPSDWAQTHAIDEAIQQMNRTLDVFRPRGYDSSVVKIKNLKGGRI